MAKEQNTLTRGNEICLRIGNRDDAKEQGIVEGYFARWDQVDSHNTRFQKGCFANSIKERKNKIVMRNSHGNPVGKPLEIREDDIGAFFVGQFSMGVQEAREAFTLISDEVVTGLSFGFQNVNSKVEKDGIRTFTEVTLLEISPTWLPSGDDSRITNVRSDEQGERSNDFDTTKLSNTGILLWESIQETTSDIWFSWMFAELDDAQTVAAIDKALTDFQAAYLEFVSDWIQLTASNADDNERSSPGKDLQKAIVDLLKSENRTVKEFAAEYKLTEDNMKTLCRGKHITDLTIVANLPTALRTLNNQLRASNLECNFTELRQFMSQPELKRSNALLAMMAHKRDTTEERSTKDNFDTDQILSALQTLNK